MTARRSRRTQRSQTPPSGHPGYFAVTLPGLGQLLWQEISATSGLRPREDVGYDGRADVVFFDVERGTRLTVDHLRLAEDLFVTVGTARSGPPRQVAASLVQRPALERSLSAWTRYGHRLHASMTVRTIARVVNESRFLRTELRNAVTQQIAANRPRWRFGDPAAIEMWVLEHREARFVAGLRLSDKRMRQHGQGRAAERKGALRPVVAAAMVRQTGIRPGRLLDPYCGSGTIVREAIEAGWSAHGSDIDLEAVELARLNVPSAALVQADGHRLPHPDRSVDAIVSNLPFGRQYGIDGEPKQWVRTALHEAVRVTRDGGRVVILVPPPVPKALPGLTLVESHRLRLLGVSTCIWVYERSHESGTGKRETATPVSAS